MSDISGRAALVTGASRGIGAAIALRLAQDGFNVVVNYANGASESQAVVDLIERRGGRAVAVQADVGDRRAVSEMFDRSDQLFGGLDVLVNNAGIMQLSSMADADDALFDASIRINLKGAFNCMGEAARRLKGGGRIVSLSSSVVGLFQPGYAVYAATKAAVEAMTHVLAKELGSKKITVNAVAPGPVATELFLRGKSNEDIAPIVGRIPLGRLGEAEDIARVISFLAGPDGAWINGQVLRANGGLV